MESIMEQAVYPMAGSQRFVNADLADAVALTVPRGAQKAEISVEGGEIRVYEGGDTPTTTAGHLLLANQWDVYGPDLDSVRLIRTSSQASLVVQVSYFSIYPPSVRASWT